MPFSHGIELGHGEGGKREEIAAHLGMGVASVYRVLAERKAAGHTKRAA